MGTAAYESRLRTCPGLEPVPKKEPWRNRPAPPAGALQPGVPDRLGASAAAPPSSPARKCALLLPRPGAPWPDLGARSPPPPPPGPSPLRGVWPGVGAGLSGRWCRAALTGLQILPGRRVPAASFRAPGRHAALPWIRRRLQATSPRPRASLHAPAYTRGSHPASDLSLRAPHRGLLSVLRIVGLGALPTFPCPRLPLLPAPGQMDSNEGSEAG